MTPLSRYNDAPPAVLTPLSRLSHAVVTPLTPLPRPSRAGVMPLPRSVAAAMMQLLSSGSSADAPLTQQ